MTSRTPAAASPPHGALVVGVGVASDQVDGARRALASVPNSPSLSFVIVPHESAEQDLASALDGATVLPIVAVEADQPLLPDTVYVPASGHELELKGDMLRARARSGDGVLDRFFTSLADAQGEAAVGVALSGGMPLCTEGFRAIKENGGLTIVDEATHSPFHSERLGTILPMYVDIALPISAITGRLLRYARDPNRRGGEDAAPSAELAETLFPIIELLRHESSNDFRLYRKNTLWRRVQRRMSLNQTSDVAEYLEMLRRDPQEVQILRRDLLICVTRFFRDADAWRALADRVLPDLVSHLPPDRPLRAWVPGCATGEEAYTLSILLHERFEELGRAPRIQVFATDIAEDALDVARAGFYPRGIEANLSPERLERFFVRDGDGYRVRKSLRNDVIFAEQNVLAQPPFSKLDLICCRNLLIYLEPEAQQRVMAVFQYALKQAGCLFLGTSETIGGASAMFTPVSRKWRIFRRSERIASPPAEPFVESAIRLPSLKPIAYPQVSRASSGRSRGLADRVQRQLLRELDRGVVAIDAQDRVLFVQGAADLFLQLSLGEVGADQPEIYALARTGIEPKLRGTIRQVRRSGSLASTQGRLDRDGRMIHCRIMVRPLEGGTVDDDTLLVTFEALHEAPTPAETVPEDASLVQELYAELASTREQLNATIEDLESANEALRASHEEAVSINEELQSGNEELETSKEELQSLNEELTTVNAQLEDKVTELQRTTNDLDNLLVSSHVPTIFLDTEWRVRRFTPSCRQLFSLIETDVGRPLTDIAAHVDDSTLIDDARAVLDDLQPRENQIVNRGGDRYYQRRLAPYRTGDGVIEGVVATFTDVTELQQATAKLRRRERQQKALAHFGQYALREKNLDLLMRSAIAAVRQAFEADFVKILEVLPDDGGLFLRAGAGWSDGLAGKLVIAPGDDSQAAYTLASKAPVVVENLPEDPRFLAPKLLLDHGIVSGISTLVQGESSPIGVLGVYTTRKAVFSMDDVDFLAALANVLSDAILLRRREESIREAEERLRLATAAHNLGTWDFDPIRGSLIVTDRAREILGFGSGGDAAVSYRRYLERIHPADRHRVAKAARDCFRPGGAAHCDIEYRTAPSPGGAVRWVRDIRQAYFSRDVLTRIIGTLEDVTARKEAEHANFERLELAERLRRIAEATPGTVFTLRGGDTASFPYVAPNVLDTWGVAASELEHDASPVFSRIHEDDLPLLRDRLDTSSREMTMWHAQFRYQHPWKGLIWIEAYASPVTQSGDTVLWHGIAHDITDQKQTELELVQARRVAEAADRAKSEFLANMSHEIRTPMSAILGYAEILSGQLQNPDNLQHLETIRSNGLYLLEIIDDILDLSRIEAGRFELDHRRARPDSIVYEVHSLLKLHASEKGLEFGVEFDGLLPETIETDPTRVRQVLINLVENAIKFTEEGSVTVNVRLDRDRSALAFDVIDTGPGISQPMLERLFLPFTQADASVRRRFGGSGLGLSICRAMARMLGGDVTVESRPDEGSTFTFTVATGSLEGVGLFKPQPRASAFPLPYAELRRLDCSVLVVDDRRDMRYLAQHMLEEAGARVTQATDGRDALEQVAAAEARGEPIDAVLLDMQMPVLDGYAAARELRVRGFERPIVALTAHAMKPDERRCLEAGCDDYLSKPLSRATLVNTIAYYTQDVSTEELRRRRHGYRHAEAVTEDDDEQAHPDQRQVEEADADTDEPGAEDGQAAKRRVLLVDDNRDSCMMLKMLLESCDCEVHIAGTAAEALDAAGANRFDAAVLDIGLPDMPGDQLAVELRKQGHTHARLICLSGRGESEVDWRGAGFDHFVRKPVRFADLKTLICD